MSDEIIEQVRAKYAAAAGSLSGDHAGVRAVAEAFGYSPDELSAVPAEANLGLSCGNPTAFASLRPGETVVDLGCGGGLDVLLAAAKVGPTGRAIGIDMTPEMIERAQRNAALQGTSNVVFHLSTIDKLPFSDASVDCVISNCVINLAPDKRAVFRELFRVLKPGGRVAVSDIALKRRLPEDLAASVAAYVGCIAGAITIDEYRRGLEEAGFAAVQVVGTGADLNAYAQVENQSGCCSPAMQVGQTLESPCGLPSPSYKPEAPARDAATLAGASGLCAPGSEVHQGLAELLRKYDINDYAASVQVYAIKAT
ncbi:MAG TPA: arsenite methyltransferase [Gemmataceae bacterium]|nr:arsenite methyltransferase [Gemmataceae bacterium]